MVRASALSLAVFAAYLFAAGSAFLFVPNVLFALFGLPPTNEPWVRVVGLLMLVIGGYYVSAGRTSAELQRASVFGRGFVAVVLTIMVVVGLLPPVALLFAAIDALGAAWTAVCLRRAHEDVAPLST